MMDMMMMSMMGGYNQRRVDMRQPVPYPTQQMMSNPIGNVFNTAEDFEPEEHKEE